MDKNYILTETSNLFKSSLKKTDYVVDHVSSFLQLKNLENEFLDFKDLKNQVQELIVELQ